MSHRSSVKASQGPEDTGAERRKRQLKPCGPTAAFRRMPALAVTNGVLGVRGSDHLQASSMRTFLVAVVCGLLGFAVGSAIYLVLNPVLEESGGLLREMQGLLWNLVPMLTLVGVALGVWGVRRRQWNR